MNKAIVLAAVAALSGCAATPSLEYHEPGPDKIGFLKFTLPQSTILLQPNPSGGLIATVVTDDDYPSAAQHSLMADAKWSLLTSTTVTKWEFMPGQNVVKAIAMTATSNVSKVVDIIKDISSLPASTATGSMAFVDDIIDPFVDAQNNARPLQINQTVVCNLHRNPEWKCELSIGDRPQWVIPFKQFRAMAIEGEARKVFPSSACVKATIRLTAPAGLQAGGSGGALSAKPGDGGGGGNSGGNGGAGGGSSDARESVRVNRDGTLAGNVGIGAMPASPRTRQPNVRTPREPDTAGQAGANQAAAGAPSRPVEFTFGLELADPTFVNLTRLRAGGELQASGPCRFNVTNDKATTNLDSEGIQAAISLVKGLKAGQKK